MQCSVQCIKNCSYFCSSSDEPEVVTFNRNVLPAYYGLLRLCCEHSRTFTRQLAGHSNMKWAFENLTTRMNQYPQVWKQTWL